MHQEIQQFTTNVAKNVLEKVEIFTLPYVKCIQFEEFPANFHSNSHSPSAQELSFWNRGYFR